MASCSSRPTWGVGADESFIEDAAGKLVEVFFFEGAEHAGADFCGVGNGIEFDAALFALFAKFFPERAQVVTPAGRGLRSTRIEMRINHRRRRARTPQDNRGLRIVQAVESSPIDFRGHLVCPRSLPPGFLVLIFFSAAEALLQPEGVIAAFEALRHPSRSLGPLLRFVL